MSRAGAVLRAVLTVPMRLCGRTRMGNATFAARALERTGRVRTWARPDNARPLQPSTRDDEDSYMKCHYCNDEKETGPYGPQGTQACGDCITADPEREAIAVQAFWDQLRAALTVSGVVVIDDDKGPQPWVAHPMFRQRGDASSQ